MRKKNPWIRWTERKPEEGEGVIVLEQVSYNGGWHMETIGTACIKVIEHCCTYGLENLWWLPLPKIKEK